MTGVFGIRRVENAGNAVERGRGLRHHIAHESNHNHREDENRQVEVELCKVAGGHYSVDHEATSGREDRQYGDVRREDNDGNESSEKAKNAQAYCFRLCIRSEKLLIFELLRVEQADQRGTENAFADHLIQRINGSLRYHKK